MSQDNGRTVNWRAVQSLWLLGYVVIVLRHAWVTEDAYITLRTVDNFIHGLGLTWNPIERVQGYTHPLWMFLLSLPFALTRDSFYTTIAVSAITSTLAVVIGMRLLPQQPGRLMFVASVCLLSRAFVDYSASGLENPLTHLLLAVFVGMQAHEPWGMLTGKGLAKLALVTALLALTRMDAPILVLPALACATWDAVRGGLRLRRALRSLCLGMLPIVLWEIFSLIYYGFPFPNTAYAKLGSSIAITELVGQAGFYLLASMDADPVTLTVTAAAAVVLLRWGGRESRCLMLGVALYYLYLFRIGGDFMNGRFLTAPLWLATLALGRSPALGLSMKSTLPWLALVWILGMGVSSPTLKHAGDYSPGGPAIDHRGIADERGFYYGEVGLLRAARTRAMPDHGWVQEGLRHRTASEQQNSIDNPRVIVHGNIGFLGYAAGPRVFIIDTLGLTEPLLARLPASRAPWRIGHMGRAVPKGYTKSIVGRCQVPDPNLCQYLDVLRLIVRGPIWSWHRFTEIVKFNLGEYDHLIDQDRYRSPDLVKVPLSRLDDPKKLGTAWDAKGTTTFQDSGLEIEMGKLVAPPRIDLSLDGYDTYELEFLNQGRLVGTLLVPPSNTVGLFPRVVDTPPPASAGKFDKIRVYPVNGDGRYSLGHLILR